MGQRNASEDKILQQEKKLVLVESAKQKVELQLTEATAEKQTLIKKLAAAEAEKQDTASKLTAAASDKQALMSKLAAAELSQQQMLAKFTAADAGGTPLDGQERPFPGDSHPERRGRCGAYSALEVALHHAHSPARRRAPGVIRDQELAFDLGRHQFRTPNL